MKVNDDFSNLTEYADIFVKVRKWANFCHHDIEDNDIHDAGTMTQAMTYQRNLSECWKESQVDPSACR